MGFMDKAKKMAEQAQTKLDEVQKGFNEGQGSQGSSQGTAGPQVQYDKHGRPVPPADTAPPAPAADRTDEYAPPTLTSGDPLAG